MRDVRQELIGIGTDVVARARKAGADHAEAVVRDGSELEVKVRLGEPEMVKEAQSRSLGLRIFKDRRMSLSFTSDLSPRALDRFVADAVELAGLAEPDPLHEPPDPADLARDVPDLDLYDPEVLRTDARLALELARRGEAAALAADPRITNSEGAVLSRAAGTSALCLSSGFSHASRGSYQSLVVEPLADDEGGKKRNGYWWTGARHAGALDSPEAVGVEAARRVVAKLGARKVATCEVPVVFERDAARALLGLLSQVASGDAIWRKSSYLVGREGTPIASPLVSIADDPLIPRAPGSRAHDGDALPSRKNAVVAGGVLETYLLDLYSARKLGRRSNGCAGRGGGGAPHVATSNFIMEAGATPAAQLVSELDQGLYVTEMMGFGFNGTTGDFSRGAGGFWIDKGQLAYPVAEITISANFDDLWRRVDAVGDDLVLLRTSICCPSFRVSRMTVAGR